MKRKLIEIRKDAHYIIADDSEIKEGDFIYESDQRNINITGLGYSKNNKDFKITHSTQSLSGDNKFNVSYKLISLSEVQELIYGYNIEKIADEKFPEDGKHNNRMWKALGFVKGHNFHKELVKDKIFSVEDMNILLFSLLTEFEFNRITNRESFEHHFNKYLQSLLPPTEWEVEFDEQGRLKLMQ